MSAKALSSLAAFASVAWGSSAVSAGDLYGVEVFGESRLTTINRSTAEQTTVGLLRAGGADPAGPFGMEYNVDDDTMYLVDAGTFTKGLYTVDLTTGAAASVGATGTNGSFGSAILRGLAYDARNGVMHSTTETNGLVRLDLASGVPVMVLSFANFGNLDGRIAYDGSGGLFGLSGSFEDNGGHHLVRIDPATGVGTSVVDLANNQTNFRSLTFDPELDVFWTFNLTTDELTAIDPLTGEVTAIGNPRQPGQSGTALNGIAYVIPAPASLHVFVSAAALCGLRRRCR